MSVLTDISSFIERRSREGSGKHRPDHHNHHRYSWLTLIKIRRRQDRGG